MKSLFKVTLLATTMAVALHAQSLLLLKLQNLLQLLTAKQRSKMTIRNQLMHWVLRWVVTWKTLLKNKKNWASNWIKIS